MDVSAVLEMVEADWGFVGDWGVVEVELGCGFVEG